MDESEKADLLERVLFALYEVATGGGHSMLTVEYEGQRYAIEVVRVEPESVVG